MPKLHVLSLLPLVLKSLLLVGLLLFVLVRLYESRVLFYPVKELEYFPDQVGLSYQNIFFDTPDKQRLHGWLIPASGAKYTLFFAHGNAGNISHRLEKIKLFHQLGYSVFIFDYRGFGQSQGRPSEKGLMQDAAAAYRYLVSRGIKAETMIGYGESLGGAVIAGLSATHPVRGIILDSTFSSIADMAREMMPIVPVWMLASRFDSAVKVAQHKTPKLIIHSMDDEVIPFKLGRKLFEAAQAPKIFLVIRGGHNSNFMDSKELWLSGIEGFINKI